MNTVSAFFHNPATVGGVFEMRKLMRFSWLALLMLGVASPMALAGKTGSSAASNQQDGVMRVDDKADVFTSSGIDTAKAKFDGVTFKAKTHYTVMTRTSVPESKKKDFEATKDDKAKAGIFFSDWAHELAKGEVGIVVLAYVNGDKFYVRAIADKASDLHRHFSDQDLKEVESKLISAFRLAKSKSGDEAKKARDAGLLESTAFVIDQLKDTTLPADSKTTSSVTKKESGGMSIMGWVCIAGAVLLGVWVVIALIRMMTGSVNGYGGGYQGGGGYGGGGGMGFMGGMMGGMFGAMAGMYMYDQMTGGHHYNDNYGSGNDGSGGDTGGSQDNGEGNFDGGSEGQGGGDWGDSGGSSDTGGGGDWGGDSGGGGDTGGGGDWGGDSGGGGDMGGGGDW
jgi:hypothetical protein